MAEAIEDSKKDAGKVAATEGKSGQKPADTSSSVSVSDPPADVTLPSTENSDTMLKVDQTSDDTPSPADTNESKSESGQPTESRNKERGVMCIL